MTKTKKIGLSVGGSVLVIAIAASVLLVTHKERKELSASAANISTSTQSATTNAAAEGPSSLSVGDSTIGQLGSTNQQANRDTASGSGGSVGNGSSPSGPQLPDPSTFKDYEKYKDTKAAMFGEVVTGNGAELKANMKAAVAYKGWLTNGQVFDQSKTGSDGKVEPFVFQMGANQVIPGWEQGLAGMKVGGIRLVIVPPSVGYGANGQGSIPPNSVLVFAVQLVAVQ